MRRKCFRRKALLSELPALLLTCHVAVLKETIPRVPACPMVLTTCQTVFYGMWNGFSLRNATESWQYLFKKLKQELLSLELGVFVSTNIADLENL